MISRAHIKQIAKDAFRTQRKAIIVGVLWYLFITAVFTGVANELFPHPIDAPMTLSAGELLFSLVQFAVTSVLAIGLTDVSLRLLDGEVLKGSSLFDRMSNFFDAFALMFVISVKTFLWALLFVVPGIIAAYRYRMAPYIWLENRSLSATQAIDLSSQMMRGHKWRLFVFDLSFIGWGFFSIITLGFGLLYVIPYNMVAEAVFYRELAAATGMGNHVAVEAGEPTPSVDEFKQAQEAEPEPDPEPIEPQPEPTEPTE